jgi:hypothetical protein
MDEVSPWSRLGASEVNVESVDSVDSVSELIALKDQVFELSKLVMTLQSRVQGLELSNTDLVENAFSLVSKEELGIEEPVVTAEDYQVAMKENEVVVIKSGFTAPTPTILAEIRETAEIESEPIGGLPLKLSDEVVEEKEFGEKYTTAVTMASLITTYINEHGAVLNNQVKRRIYTPNDLDVTTTDKQLLKELIERNDTAFSATKLDSFRTLYFIGEDAGVEYEKSYGQKSS